MSHVAQRKFTHCPNCQYTFKEVDNYCARCGQENHDFRLPAGHLFLELLENTLHFDTKFFTTVKYLLLKPGKLTEEFIGNRRASYVPPFRLYVFISFFFFLILSFAVGGSESSAPGEPGVFSGQTLDAHGNRVRTMFFGLIVYDLEAKNDRAGGLTQGQPEKKGKFHQFMERQEAKWLQKSDAEVDQKILKTISMLMFFLMPLFALILKGFHLRQKKFYIEHLIFSIHVHCFVFILLSLVALLGNWLQVELLVKLAFAVMFVYLFVALRRVFHEKVLTAFMKTLLVHATYLMVLVFSLALALFVNYTLA
ncbi:DUF3667 domain-containing protein [Rufibacter glacialis]|uniref:DUF3667 domain-containing protein n=1 Tax=Rufibacter glacialis TaxID=1259555 RepID=A0A5M8QLL0_9BACT|nr:DUF3667 domain-containing protein [Rufibacter glacialis]KAA6435656.1 DUF3667 domain-containing protein [Rufibacter glacialis]GGK65313.1 hypothetical protein GCM10011405_11680 [Rufibacter glacialis]